MVLSCNCSGSSNSSNSEGTNDNSSCYTAARHVSLSLWDGPLWREPTGRTRAIAEG